MGKVPGWAIPMVVYSSIGFGSGMVAVIELLYLLGLLSATHDSALSAAAAGVFGLIAVGGFAATWGSWKKVKASWAREGVRLCMNCGRLTPLDSATCTGCGHSFA